MLKFVFNFTDAIRFCIKLLMQPFVNKIDIRNTKGICIATRLQKLITKNYNKMFVIDFGVSFFSPTYIFTPTPSHLNKHFTLLNTSTATITLLVDLSLTRLLKCLPISSISRYLQLVFRTLSILEQRLPFITGWSVINVTFS